jgi:hypothetical protein
MKLHQFSCSQANCSTLTDLSYFSSRCARCILNLPTRLCPEVIAKILGTVRSVFYNPLGLFGCPIGRSKSMLGTFSWLEEIGSSLWCCQRNSVCFEAALRIQRLGATATPTLTTPSATSPAVARIRPPTTAKVAPEAQPKSRQKR